MENHRDNLRREFDRLLAEEKRLIHRVSAAAGYSAELLRELARIQQRRAEIGRKLNIGIFIHGEWIHPALPADI